MCQGRTSQGHSQRCRLHPGMENQLVRSLSNHQAARRRRNTTGKCRRGIPVRSSIDTAHSLNYDLGNRTQNSHHRSHHRNRRCCCDNRDRLWPLERRSKKTATRSNSRLKQETSAFYTLGIERALISKLLPRRGFLPTTLNIYQTVYRCFFFEILSDFDRFC